MASTSLDQDEDIKMGLEPTKSICRCCLSTDRRMIDTMYFEAFIRDLTGINVSESDGLPQWLCYECCSLLQKSVRFKYKMLRAHNILYEYSTRCAPFPIDATDEELSKYASPHLCATTTLSLDLTTKGKMGFHKVFQHEKQLQPSILDELELPTISKVHLEAETIKHSESDVKEETGFSDYEDNITLHEFRSVANKITEEDIESLLQEANDENLLDLREKKKKRTKKKEQKIKKKKSSKKTAEDGEEELPETKSSIRKAVDIDPTKIRIVMLNPEEQVRQREEESKASMKFPYQCTMCFKGFNFEFKLQNHLSKHSPSRGTYECKLCHMYLPTTYSFNVHTLIHTRRFECIECGRRMIDRASIMDHYRVQHEGLSDIYTCHLCGKISNNSKTHRSHMRNHHGGERPKCELCGKSFVNKDSLAEHLQIHQGIKNYECSICNKRFRTRTQIKHHQTKHSDAKHYYCVECDVRFKSAHSLRKHLQQSLKHKDKQSLKFACSRCDKRYATARQLQQHVRVQHEGLRAHPCADCGAALASRSSLRKHAHTVHRGRRARPTHVCHTCGKAFAAKSILVNHVRTHTGEKPFECCECGRKFSQRTAMNTHVKLVHLKIRRGGKVKQDFQQPLPPPSPKPELLKPEPQLLDPWRQPTDLYFTVTAGP